MKQHSGDEIDLRRYLLGDLTLEERVAIEERLFLDGDYLQLLKATEDELLDEYVYNELTADERNQLELHFLPEPGRLEELKFAKAFKNYVSSEVAPVRPIPVSSSSDARSTMPAHNVSFLHSLFGRRPVVGFSFALVLILVVGLIWFATDSVRKRESPQAQKTGPQQTEVAVQPGTTERTLTNENTSGEGSQLTEARGNTPPVSGKSEIHVAERGERRPRRMRGTSSGGVRQPGRTLMLLLAPGSVIREDGETNNLDIPSDVDVVILQLALVERDDYRNYHALLRADKQTIRSRTVSKTTVMKGIKVVSLEVPARLLRQQNYQVKLRGRTPAGRVQEIASYFFKVTKPTRIR